MKKILMMMAVVLSATGIKAQDAEFLITGVTPDSVKTIYYAKNANFRQIDSLKVQDGKFQLSDKAPLNTFYSFISGRKSITIMTDHTPTTVNFKNGKVTGSPTNVQFTDMQKSIDKQNEKLMGLYKENYELRSDQTVEGVTKKKTLEKQMAEIQDKQKNDIVNYAKTHQNDASPAYFIGTHYYAFDYDNLNQMLNTNAAYYDHPLVKSAKDQKASLEKRRPGLQFTDLTMQDMDGKTVKLSQWVGKGNYALVDFWASWCGPCRAEMPNVVDAYKRYHAAKGLEIVGVSFDQKADSWKKAVKDLGMDWHQMSDLKGWKCAAHDVYGVNAIPSNILVDPQGKIVACDLRGVGLANKLKEIYGY